jgi:hypothetical protein
MRFALIIHDNNEIWGRTDFDEMTVFVANTGPFDVTFPNGGESLDGYRDTHITWTVNNTDTHCPEVNILLSRNNGVTYEAIGKRYPNSGSAIIQFPNENINRARICIQCANASTNQMGGIPEEEAETAFAGRSTFFDISNGFFNIREIIPVEFIDFVSTQENKIVFLDWTTSFEIINKGFEVQRSKDNLDWEDIGFITGAGNSEANLSYRFIDLNPHRGINYYRLKQLSYSDAISYSNVVEEFIDIEGNYIKIYPNPVSEQLNISVYLQDFDQKLKLSIYDITGRLVRSQDFEISIGNQLLSMDVFDMESGMYVLELLGTNFKWLEKLIIKRI